MNQGQWRQAFPPDWRLGDAWVVEMTTQMRLGNWDLVPQKVQFKFSVVAVPRAEEATYVLQADCVDCGAPEGYRVTYRAADFSYVRVDRVGDSSHDYLSVLDNAADGPFMMDNGVVPVFLDFPVRPDPQNPLRPMEFPVLNRQYSPNQTMSQTFSEMGGGFTITIDQRLPAKPAPWRTTVMTWKAGDPWWSTLDRVSRMPPFPDKNDGSGRLISVGPLSPR